MSHLSESQLATVSSIRDQVKKILGTAEAGHDWWHIHRVFVNACRLCEEESVDQYVVQLSALLHDIADAKFHDGDETIGPEVATSILKNEHVDQDVIDHVVNIIKHMSYKNSLDGLTWSSKEMEVVQDADRLDAIGAIGIARAFSYGGHKGRVFFDPSILPDLNMTKEAYKKSTAPTINHFYEKLLLLKEKMNTKSGKKLAQERHDYMRGFLEQFYKEWYGHNHVPEKFEIESKN